LGSEQNAALSGNKLLLFKYKKKLEKNKYMSTPTSTTTTITNQSNVILSICPYPANPTCFDLGVGKTQTYVQGWRIAPMLTIYAQGKGYNFNDGNIGSQYVGPYVSIDCIINPDFSFTIIATDANGQKFNLEPKWLTPVSGLRESPVNSSEENNSIKFMIIGLVVIGAFTAAFLYFKKKQ
jgi:hypothetical protein